MLDFRRLTPVSFGLLGLIIPGVSSAVPSTAEQIQILQDELFQNRQAQQIKPDPDIRLDASGLKSPASAVEGQETPCFIINEIILEEYDPNEESAKPTPVFQWILSRFLHPDLSAKMAGEPSPKLGKCYGVAGINAIMSSLQNKLIESGYITTRIVAGPQELSTGVLRLIVVPGRISTIHFQQAQHPPKLLLPLRSGQLLNLRNIEQGLENLKTLPSVVTDIQIIPSQSVPSHPGDSDLLVVWRQGRPWRLTLSADNSGSESTGKYQGSLNFAYDNPTGLGDSLNVHINRNLSETEPTGGHSESSSVSYSLPVKKWALSFNASENKYLQIVEGAFTDSDYSGNSQNYGLDLSRMMYRNAKRKTHLSLNAWLKESKNFIDDIEVKNQRKRIEGYTLSIKHKEFIGPATVDASVAYKKIHQADDLSLALAADNSDAKPAILNTDVSLDWPFKLGQVPFRYFSQWRHQKNLDVISSQDYFSIGNQYNVRTGRQQRPVS